MAPASTFHRLTTASAQTNLNLSPKLQAYMSTGCPLDLVPWGPSGHLSPYICHFSDSLSRTATRSYPDPHPLFHLTSHQIPGFGLLSLSSTYALTHLPEPRLSRHRSGQPQRAPWLQACPVCSAPPTEAWGIFCKCKSDHITSVPVYCPQVGIGPDLVWPSPAPQMGHPPACPIPLLQPQGRAFNAESTSGCYGLWPFPRCALCLKHPC